MKLRTADMELGVISDTHGLVRPEVFAVFAGVDLIVHAGDIGEYDVIQRLESIAPVRAVTGNNDYGLPPPVKETLAFRLHARRFSVQHILRGVPEGGDIREDGVTEVVIFGHSHSPLIRQVGGRLFVNPGSAGPKRFDLPITVGRISLSAQAVRAEIISLAGECVAV